MSGIGALLQALLDSARAHRWPLLTFLGLAALRVGDANLDVAGAVVLTRSEIPVGDVLWSPYSPAYLFLLHLWSGISGAIPWLRGLSLLLALAGLLLVPRVLRGLGGTHAAGGALWILVLSPFFAAQMVAVSPSALAFLAVVVELACFLEFLRAGRPGWLAGWMAAALVSLLVHGGLYYLVSALCLGMALYRGRYAGQGRQRLWWLAQLPVLGLFLVLFGRQFERFVAHRVTQVNDPAAAADQWADIGSGLPGAWMPLAGALLAVLVLSGLSACRDSRRDPRHGLLALGAVIPCAVWLVWLPHDFYAVAALPFLAVLASMGIRLYPRWGRQIAWAGLLVIVAAAHWQAL